MANRLSRFEYFDTPAGRTDAAWQLHAFKRFAATPSDSALQLGVPSIAALSQTKAALRILASDRAPLVRDNDVSMILCEETALPLESESIDLILWPHGLDRHANSAPVLSEISRVLSPEGLLVVTFFNSRGPWALRRKLAFVPPLLPEDICPCSVSSAKAQLLRAGLATEGGAYGVYGIDPKEASGEKSALEKAGDRWWPVFGNLIVLTARKHVSGMHLVGKAQFSSPNLGRFGAAAAGNGTQKESL